MKILYPYILIFVISLTFGQNSVNIIKDTINTENKQTITEEITNTTKSKKDKNFKDTVVIAITANDNIIVTSPSKDKDKKSESKIDLFKYIFPIFTLFLGIWIKRFFDKKSQKEKIENAGKRWLGELRSLEEPLNLQISSLENYLKEHQKEDFIVPGISVYSSLSGDIFKSLDKNELIEYIESQNLKKDFKEIVKISNQTHGFTTILIHLSESLKDKFNKYVSNTSLHTTSLSESLQNFNVAIANYSVEIEVETGTDPGQSPNFKPIYELYHKHIVPHLEDGKFNPYILEKEFFIPLLHILSHLRLDERTKPLTNAVSSALNSIKGIKMEKLYMEQNIMTILERYKNQLTDLDSVTSGIESKKA